MDIQATKQRINTIGEHLASLSNEAECGFAELSKLATILADELTAAREALEGSGEAIRHMASRAVGYRKERDRLQGETDGLRQRVNRLANIMVAAEKAESSACYGTREEAIRAAADVFRVIFADAEHGVNIPEVLECPYGEPMHDAGDGCPCCMEVEAWAGEIASELRLITSPTWPDGSDLSDADYSAIQQTIFRCLQERRVYPRSKSEVDAENGIIDFGNGKGTATIHVSGHQLKGFVPADGDAFVRIERGHDDEPVPSATMDEWHRMREYMQTGGVTEDCVLDMINEAFARVKANGGFDRIMTEDRVREIIREELEPKPRPILPVAQRIMDAAAKHQEEMAK